MFQKPRSALVLALVIAMTLVSLSPALTSSPAQAACTDRYAVVLAGYNTKSEEVGSFFKDIREKVLSKFSYKDIIEFSYKGSGNKYSVDDTFNALPTSAANFLRDTIQDKILSKCDDANIDILGHSLGGAVAFEYISTFLNTDHAKKVKHIITLDSPVNGSKIARLSFIAAGFGNSGLLGSPTANYLSSRFESQNTKQLNINVAKAIANRTVVRTFGSRDDRVVSHIEAEIPGFQRDFSLGVSLGDCLPGGDLVACAGHRQILKDSKSLDAIEETLKLVPGRLDVVFVIDTTTSMGPFINAVKAAAVDIVNGIPARVTDSRIGLVQFKDFPPPIGQPVDFPAGTVQPYTANTNTAVNAINGLTLAGGGFDTPEAVFSGLRHAILDPSVGGFRDGASKQVILFGDAPPKDPEPVTGFRRKDVVDAANSVDPAIVQTIALGTNPATVTAFALIASDTGGNAFTATSATNVVGVLTDAIEAAALAPGGPVTGSDSPTEFPASVASSPPTTGDDKPDVRRLTEEQRQQRGRTDTSSLDDTRTEGNVVAASCESDPPTVEIANRDGKVTVRLLKETRTQCDSSVVGGYGEFDGEKIHEFLFEAYNATFRKVQTPERKR
jgi:hypothetical protein